MFEISCLKLSVTKVEETDVSIIADLYNFGALYQGVVYAYPVSLLKAEEGMAQGMTSENEICIQGKVA